jgi:hypothetical protein
LDGPRAWLDVLEVTKICLYRESNCDPSFVHPVVWL